MPGLWPKCSFFTTLRRTHRLRSLLSPDTGLIESDDEDIIEAVQEALPMAEESFGEDADGEDDIFPE
jgi:hypothetical protein